jgi:hypothetical protein
MIKIDSYENLLKHAEECLKQKKTLGHFEIDNALDYNIKITGETWDGSIDYRLAQYIVDTQKAIDNLFEELGIALEEEDRPVITFKIEAGCTKLIVQISKTFEKLIENMTSGEKIYVATLLFLAVVGGITVHEFREYKSEQEAHAFELKSQKQTNDKELKQQELLVDVIDSLVDKIPVYATPTKRLAKNLREKDEIENSINPIKRTKKELKKEYPGKGKYKAESVYLDGKYIITAIILETGKITIEQGSHKYDCLSSLNESEAKKLFSKVQDAHAKKKGFELDLKITADYFKGSKNSTV